MFRIQGHVCEFSSLQYTLLGLEFFHAFIHILRGGARVFEYKRVPFYAREYGMPDMSRSRGSTHFVSRASGGEVWEAPPT